MIRLTALAILLGTTVAHADGGSLPDGATLSFDLLYLHENNSQAQNQPIVTPTSLWTYFNYAHCACGLNAAPDLAHMPWYENTFAYKILLNNQTTLVRAPLEIWVGTSCDDPIMRPMNCHKVAGAGTADISSIVTASPYFAPEVPILDLMVPEPSMQGMGCPSRVLSTAEWAISDVNPDGSVGSTPQYFVSQGIDTNSLAPTLPTNFSAEGADSAIQISWTPSTDISDVVAYYQALCIVGTDGNGGAAKGNPPAAKYETPHTLCGAAGGLASALMPTILPLAAGAPDAGNDVALGNLTQVDPSLICGEVDDATATGMRIDGLQNGTTYTVALLAIDKFGNASGTYFTSGLTPKPVTDFWQDLHERGSKTEGGFCLIAQTYGDDHPLTRALRGFRDGTLATTAFGRGLTAIYYGSLGKLGAVVHGHMSLRIIAGVLLLPLVAVALLWHVLTLPVLVLVVGLVVFRRRIRPARLAPALVAFALLVLAPRRAGAQTPYWEDKSTLGSSDTESFADSTDAVTWHAGIRVGPYTPQIDAQLQSQTMTRATPYRDMFGGYKIMPMLDVDRILWRGFGQLGVGVSIGYMSKSAQAWAICAAGDPTCISTPGNPARTRSPGDKNSFKLIPGQLTAVYRLTFLDDEYGIPLVPYVRAGLGYYAWWVSAPSGNFSRACTNGTATPGCATTTGAGASFGVVGSIGLAIRAERIDATAARSMHESGIEHAGFYGELNAGKVDGLGLDKTKLAVGDATWFAGVDFEF